MLSFVVLSAQSIEHCSITFRHLSRVTEPKARLPVNDCKFTVCKRRLLNVVSSKLYCKVLCTNVFALHLCLAFCQLDGLSLPSWCQFRGRRPASGGRVAGVL